MHTRIVLLALAVLSLTSSIAQSKKELKAKIADLEKQIAQTTKERETLRSRLERIASVPITAVITPEQQPTGIKVGESGWRVELNGDKYKSDLLGQLGTLWYLDSNDQLKPYGAITVADYKITPTIISDDNTTLYKYFVSKGSQLTGDGGVPFAKLTASLKNDQYSNLSITIAGTSEIKPSTDDLGVIAGKVADLYRVLGAKAVFLCTGMHVVRYRSEVFEKNEGGGKINTPVINIAGEFFSESKEEQNEYLVVRQMTQLIRPQVPDPVVAENGLNALVNSKSDATIQREAVKYTPQQILSFLFDHKATFEDVLKFQDDPEHMVFNKTLNANELLLLESAKKRIVELPIEIKLDDHKGTKAVELQ